MQNMPILNNSNNFNNSNNAVINLSQPLYDVIEKKMSLMNWLMMQQNFYNLLSLILAFMGFFICWYWSHRYQKSYSISRLNKQLRELWVKFFAESKIDPMVAINALRNSILVGTALSSAAILFILALFNLLGNLPRLHQLLQGLPFETSTQGWLEFKVMVLIAWQMIIFFSFMTSIRYYRHVSFVISIPFTQAGYQSELLTIYINRAAHYYSIGQKLMQFSVPLCAWFLGNFALLATTVVTILMIYLADRFEAR